MYAGVAGLHHGWGRPELRLLLAVHFQHERFAKTTLLQNLYLHNFKLHLLNASCPLSAKRMCPAQFQRPHNDNILLSVQKSYQHNSFQKQSNTKCRSAAEQM
jgi:hypothetical protein